MERLLRLRNQLLERLQCPRLLLAQTISRLLQRLPASQARSRPSSLLVSLLDTQSIASMLFRIHPSIHHSCFHPRFSGFLSHILILLPSSLSLFRFVLVVLLITMITPELSFRFLFACFLSTHMIILFVAAVCSEARSILTDGHESSSDAGSKNVEQSKGII